MFHSYTGLRPGDHELSEEDQRGFFGCWVFVIALVFFISSTYFTWLEINYILRSDKTEATVTRISIETRMRGRRFRRPRKYLLVLYRFNDSEGLKRTGRYEDSEDAEWQQGERFEVEYLPGEDGHSRPAGAHSYGSVAFFLVSLIFLTVVGIKVGKEAIAYSNMEMTPYDPLKRNGKKKKRKRKTSDAPNEQRRMKKSRKPRRPKSDEWS